LANPATSRDVYRVIFAKAVKLNYIKADACTIDKVKWCYKLHAVVEQYNNKIQS